MSICPNARMQKAMRSRTSGSLETSAAKHSARPPVLRMAAATPSASSRLWRQLTTTPATSRPSSSAMARPMPREAPVTRAYFPFREDIRISSSPFSGQGKAAICNQRLAANPICFRTTKKRYDGCKVVGGAEPANGRAHDNLLRNQVVVGKHLHGLGVDKAPANHVDVDSIGRHLKSKIASQVFNGRLGRA